MKNMLPRLLTLGATIGGTVVGGMKLGGVIGAAIGIAGGPAGAAAAAALGAVTGAIIGLATGLIQYFFVNKIGSRLDRAKAQAQNERKKAELLYANYKESSLKVRERPEQGAKAKMKIKDKIGNFFEDNSTQKKMVEDSIAALKQNNGHYSKRQSHEDRLKFNEKAKHSENKRAFQIFFSFFNRSQNVFNNMRHEDTEKYKPAQERNWYNSLFFNAQALKEPIERQANITEDIPKLGALSTENLEARIAAIKSL